jgi:hypothetical protein
LSFFYTMLGVCLFVPVVAGLYVRRVGAPEIWAAIGAGVTALLATQLADDHRVGLGLDPVLLGLSASVAACGIVGLARHRAT